MSLTFLNNPDPAFVKARCAVKQAGLPLYAVNVMTEGSVLPDGTSLNPMASGAYNDPSDTMWITPDGSVAVRACTIVHEYAHALHFRALSGDKSAQQRAWQILMATTDTKEFRFLAMGETLVPWMANWDYALEAHEMFARALAQWVCTQFLPDEWQEYLQNPGFRDLQWKPEDFTGIANTITTVVNSRGATA